MSAVIEWFKGYKSVGMISRDAYKYTGVDMYTDHWFEPMPNICERWNDNLRNLVLGLDKQRELDWYNTPPNTKHNKY